MQHFIKLKYKLLTKAIKYISYNILYDAIWTIYYPHILWWNVTIELLYLYDRQKKFAESVIARASSIKLNRMNIAYMFLYFICLFAFELTFQFIFKNIVYTDLIKTLNVILSHLVKRALHFLMQDSQYR